MYNSVFLNILFVYCLSFKMYLYCNDDTILVLYNDSFV